VTEKRKTVVIRKIFIEIIFWCMGFWAVGVSFSAVEFNPGQPIYDTSGNVLNAHGFDIQKFNNTWYWYGNAPRTPGCDFGCYGGINCYSSTDLKNWRFEGMVQTASGTGYLGTNSVAYDPHVLYNSTTSKYVMILSECCPGDRHLCYAVSSTPNGYFSYSGWSKGANNSGPYDMMAFKDDDGAGYVIYSADNNGVAIDKLGNDYLSVASRVAYFGSGNCEEAPCLFKANGRYYLYDSYCAGWSPNQGHYRTATNLAGPWSSLTNIGDGTTYNSQGTCIIPIMGTVDTTYVYVADRWNCTTSDCNYYRNSTYVFLPLILNGTALSLNWYDTWYLNVSAGTWSLVNDTTAVLLPVFSPAPGWYTGTQTVAITCATTGAVIRYTNDGTDPTTSSPAYINPITVTRTTTIKARAFKNGMTDSDIATAMYLITASDSAWTIFTSQTPSNPNITDNQSYELGTRFTSNSAGKIMAIRYYKASGETGAHIGRIWSGAGTQLTTVSFSHETGSGWQVAILTNPLNITAGTVYVVSVNCNSYYAATSNGLANAVVNGPLSTVVGSNGVYNAPGVFPTQTYQNSNYFRDVLFMKNGGPAIIYRPVASAASHPGSFMLYDLQGRLIGNQNSVIEGKMRMVHNGRGIIVAIVKDMEPGNSSGCKAVIIEGRQ
jgi:hypothetical protein